MEYYSAGIRAIRGYDLFKGAIKRYLFKKASMVIPRASVIMITREFWFTFSVKFKFIFYGNF